MKTIYLTLWTFKGLKPVEIVASGTLEEMKSSEYYKRRALRKIMPGEYTEEKAAKYKVEKIELLKEIGKTNA